MKEAILVAAILLSILTVNPLPLVVGLVGLVAMSRAGDHHEQAVQKIDAAVQRRDLVAAGRSSAADFLVGLACVIAVLIVLLLCLAVLVN